MKKLWIIVVAVMVSAFALTGCGGNSGAKSAEPAQSAASSSAAEPAPTADEKATITLQDEKNTKVKITDDGTKRIVRVTYYASIGSGDAAYEAEVTIDLSDVK